ncbi:MAG: hypothetical protein GX410_02835 [Elusimicrobia bacterium]|nr:hypothetical protein [Elusimicrobiota bacterium]
MDNRPDFIRTLLETASSELQGAGYAHYEISNYAKPGFECRHNLNYWDNGEYLGLGCSAASHIGGVRKINGPMLDLYCKFIEEDNSSTFSCVEKLEGKEKLGETLMLGLRKLGGMSVTREMQAAFGRDFDELESQGLLLREKDVIRLAAGAVYVSNAVFRRFVPPFD